MNLRPLLLSTLFVVTLAAINAAPAATPATEPETIKATRLTQNAAIAKSEVEAVASFWTDDVTICRGLGVQLAGKAAYRKLFEADAATPNRIVYERLPSAIDVSPHWPLAFETGMWNGHLGDLTGPVVISGRYSAQWVKRGEKWLIRAEVYVALEGAGVGLESKAAP
jgi:ketosteroid isomerase-like protein